MLTQWIPGGFANNFDNFERSTPPPDGNPPEKGVPSS